METIQDLQQLRSIVGEPGELTINKIYDHLNEQASDFITRSPFLVLSTVDEDGMPTASPKGDIPGFVHQADERTLYMPERKGNRLVISYQNVLATKKVSSSCCPNAVRRCVSVATPSWSQMRSSARNSMHAVRRSCC
jgi:predicted pyridoxine 5'-phosphate oxidase superfamily flavin-nucleotide-binding protein